jgi:hypothetical protein
VQCIFIPFDGSFSKARRLMDGDYLQQYHPKYKTHSTFG